LERLSAGVALRALFPTFVEWVNRIHRNVVNSPLRAKRGSSPNPIAIRPSAVGSIGHPVNFLTLSYSPAVSGRDAASHQRKPAIIAASARRGTTDFSLASSAKSWPFLSR